MFEGTCACQCVFQSNCLWFKSQIMAGKMKMICLPSLRWPRFVLFGQIRVPGLEIAKTQTLNTKLSTGKKKKKAEKDS